VKKIKGGARGDCTINTPTNRAQTRKNKDAQMLEGSHALQTSPTEKGEDYRAKRI